MTGHNEDPLSSSSSPVEPDNPLVVLEFSSFEDFLQDSSSRICSGGLFLEAEPRERVGSPVSFELRIRDGFRLLRGEGEVIRVHDPLPSSGDAAGVTVRFTNLDTASRKLLPVVLDHYHQKGIPLLDLAEEVSNVEVAAPNSVDQEPTEVTLEDLWEEFEVVAEPQVVVSDDVESSAGGASEPLLVEVGQTVTGDDREETGGDLAAAAAFLDEVKSNIEADAVVERVETKAEATSEAEDEADLDQEDATAEEAGEGEES